METLEEEREQARRLGRHSNREARRHPSSPYAGLERLEPDTQRRYFIDASADYDAQYTIWMHGSTVTGAAHDV